MKFPAIKLPNLSDPGSLPNPNPCYLRMIDEAEQEDKREKASISKDQEKLETIRA